jgi:hypothetical protein
MMFCAVFVANLLPLLWIDAWIGTDFVWRGHQMSIATDVPVP